MNHITVGVYLDQSYVINVVSEEDLKSHISYNETFRPGRLFFVDGKYHSGGLLYESALKKMIIEWENKIKDFKVDLSKPSSTYR